MGTLPKAKTKTEIKLHPRITDKTLGWGLVLIGFSLSIIEHFLKIDFFIASWHIISYLLLLLPLLYMIQQKKLINPYTQYFMPLLFLIICNMFYYNNGFVQHVLPIIFYLLVFMFYITSMHSVHSIHQVLCLRNFNIRGFSYLTVFMQNLFSYNIDKNLYSRIMKALLITLPFLIMFALLLSSADREYSAFFTALFTIDIPFEAYYIMTVPLTFILYLLFFIFSFSNDKDRQSIQETNTLDMLIIGIFLGMINLLFFSFIAMQIPFLSTGYIREGINIASFAREGFFQLMTIMGLVSLIFLFILRRHKDEKVSTVLLVILLAQSIIMGIISLKKMYLYQNIMGATVLRYYVEWFDYFLLSILSLGILFLIKRYAFSKFLDMIVVLGFLSLTLVSSLNIDAIVAKNHIEKFKDTPHKLDKNMLQQLSIDALPIIKKHHIKVIERSYTKRKSETMCKDLASYHYGFCSIRGEFGGPK
ncbi:hypothetical protein MNB_SV-13-1410 [hydrothermal vent metagenome]|uniref:Uncharacterized protein n=1 Tax=hydrothermal vent metagenome TaxID=652676 RepID=A0A1W1CZY5_9ZZZZ